MIWSIGQARITVSTGEHPHPEPRTIHNFSCNKHYTSSRLGRRNHGRYSGTLTLRSIGFGERYWNIDASWSTNCYLYTHTRNNVIIFVIVVVRRIRPVRCNNRRRRDESRSFTTKPIDLNRARVPIGYLLNSFVADQCMQITCFRESLCLRPAIALPSNVCARSDSNRSDCCFALAEDKAM